MKRFLITLSAIAMVAFAAQSQAAGMYAGIKGGVNIANVRWRRRSGRLQLAYRLPGRPVHRQAREPNIGFRLEGLYVQKGAKADEEITPGNTVEVTSKLDYIEFPILFVYTFPAGETLDFNLFAGPTLGFNISAKAEA
jgi:hypothetical protein